FDLAECLQHAQVAGEFGSAGGHAGDDGEHLRVELPRVRLARHRDGDAESDGRGDVLVESAYLLVITGKQLEEARLRARRSFHAAAGQRVDAVRQIRE